MFDRSQSTVARIDPEIHAAIEAENRRQEEHIELIASENYTSPAVMAAQGSQLTNKYAEGYPGKRYYGGCEFVDVVEQLAIDRIKRLFGAAHANVQANSGSQANQAVFFGLLQPGDTIMGMSLAEGGHLTHGMPLNMSGKWFKVVSYGLDANEAIDYDAMERLAHEHKPKLIIAGASAYSLRIDFERFAKVAKAIGAVFMVDMAHYAGLIAAGVYPNPVPFADVVTSTTHKSLRGPRGGIILMNDEAVAKKINSAIFPGIQGGPLMHVIAAKAVAFQEALSPEFKTYQQQVLKNADVLARTLIERGLRIVSGRTESHVMLVDLRPKGLTGKAAEDLLGRAHMTCNKNGIPNDPQKPMVTSGIRLGSPAMTTRGFKEEQAQADRAPDRRRAGQAAGRGRPCRRARQGGGADARVPGLPLEAAAAMRCPYCSHDETQVVETRESDEGGAIRRRRRCQSCEKRFTTYERAEIAMPAVVKKDGSRVEFDAAKLRASMLLALRKRPVSIEQVDAALERIQDKLLASGAKEVTSARLGELLMRELKRIDKVAYVRFASVYRSFEDVDEFRQLIRDI